MSRLHPPLPPPAAQWVLILLVAIFLSATTVPAAAEMDGNCFDFVWRNARDDPWFLDEQARRVVPEVTREWLVVAPAEPDLPADFDRRYAEFFDYRLPLPGGTGEVPYRLRAGSPGQTFEALMARLRADPAVRFVRPAWTIGGQLHAPPDRIRVIWKSVVPPQERRQLLESAGAVDTTAGGAPDAVLIRIDPCRRAPWQAAVLLAQDLRVVSAVPRLFKIEDPVSIRFDLETQGALPGDPIPFRLEIRFREGIRIDSATLANLDLRPKGIFRDLYEVHFDQPLSAIDPGHSPIEVTGHLVVYAPGETVIPPVPVYYTDTREEDSERKTPTVSTPAVPLRVAALVPDAPGNHRLRVSPVVAPARITLPRLPERLRTAVLMSCAGLILLAAGIVGWFWLNRREVPVEGDSGALRRERLRDDLAAWIDHDPAAIHMEDLAAFGAALKDFLGETAGLPPGERGGGHAFFLGKLENRLTDGDRTRTATLLREIDHLLAGGPITAERVRPLLDQAKILLETLAAPGPGGNSGG